MSTTKHVLVVNAGSSSLKLRLLDGDENLVRAADLDAPQGLADRDEVRAGLADWPPVAAAGHRIVHGGTQYTGPVRIEPPVRRRLEALTDLAPLHQPKSLAALDLVHQARPEVPAIGCFDTAFHARMPAGAATFALPRSWRQRWSLRRYGFHGLSHAYAARRAAHLLGADPHELRSVICHLGAGASLAAVSGRRSVDTTMGFTPLDGLVMATRSGSVDPGLVLWLAEHARTPPEELAATLEHRSGLFGLAGTADMREILTRACRGDDDAELALQVYTHRLRGGIAAMVAALGGLDALVFTGGVGENSAPIRARTIEGLDFLGLSIDPHRNETVSGDGAISTASAGAQSLVITAREDIEIARQVRDVLDRPSGRLET